MPKQTELRLLPPRLLPLTPERGQVVVRLLSELLLAEAARRLGSVFGSASDGVSGGASGVVVPFPEKRVKVRKAA